MPITAEVDQERDGHHNLFISNNISSIISIIIIISSIISSSFIIRIIIISIISSIISTIIRAAFLLALHSFVGGGYRDSVS